MMAGGLLGNRENDYFRGRSGGMGVGYRRVDQIAAQSPESSQRAILVSAGNTDRTIWNKP
jgi:hypothetical protein